MTVQGAHTPSGEILKSENRNKNLHYEKNKTLERFVQRRGQVLFAWRNLGLALAGPWKTSSQVIQAIPICCFQVKEHLQRVLVT